MRLRVAKRIDRSLACNKGCGHRWGSLVRAVFIICRAVRRKSRRVPLRHLDYWTDADRAQAGLPPGKDGHL